MLRVFDCSNSSARPTNRNFGGPIQNEFVGLLHKHSEFYGFEFVESVDECDLIFTNDVYPEHILTSSKPKVKRMDGIFWMEEYRQRNEKYNLAAKQSDLVIFISEYSKQSYEKLYSDKIENSKVITHWVEKKQPFYFSGDFNNQFFVMATDWQRKEKRFGELIKFSELTGSKIHLVGKCEMVVPENIICHGYLEPDSVEFLNVLKQSSAFLNLTCKDAATKTVCVSINCGMPVLFSNSGGVSELVGECGVGIFENDEIEFCETVPELNEFHILQGCEKFVNQFEQLKNNCLGKLRTNPLKESLRKYFQAMKEMVK